MCIFIKRFLSIMSANVLAEGSVPLTATVELNNGKHMPIVGFGTFRVTGEKEIHKCVDAALEAGYRSFDTAAVYRNEQHLGKAFTTLLPKYNLKREDIFITSKLAPADLYPENVEQAVMTSCSNLQTSYLDLYLVHWPGAAGIPGDDARNGKVRNEAWKILTNLNKNGVLHSIGVSNYTIKHLQQVFAIEGAAKPVLNQVEIHPHFLQPELVAFCRKNNIFVQAYCSLGGTDQKSLLNDPAVVKVAQKLNHSPAQILLRWALQENLRLLLLASASECIAKAEDESNAFFETAPVNYYSVSEINLIIPKSVTPSRIKENIQLDFKIPEEDMANLNNIATKEKFGWDPETIN